MGSGERPRAFAVGPVVVASPWIRPGLALLASHPVRSDCQTTAEKARPFTLDELHRSVGRIKNGKAPGPDGILPEITKVAVSCGRDLFLEITNGIFPVEMKEARLALIPKVGKSTEVSAKAYRPISLLGVFGKILKSMLEQKLKSEIEKKGGLHDRQYGFRMACSTIGAMKEVTDIVRRHPNTKNSVS